MTQASNPGNYLHAAVLSQHPRVRFASATFESDTFEVHINFEAENIQGEAEDES